MDALIDAVAVRTGLESDARLWIQGQPSEHLAAVERSGARRLTGFGIGDRPDGSSDRRDRRLGEVPGFDVGVPSLLAQADGSRETAHAHPEHRASLFRDGGTLPGQS